MTAIEVTTRKKRKATKPAVPVDSVRIAGPSMAEESRRLSLPTTKAHKENGELIFDARRFLAKAGLGKKLVSLKKGQAAYVQGDPADSVYFVQSGRVRVTVISASGKIATIALLGAGDFLGEDCMISGHPLRLATATALTNCALLSIRKAEMVRVLRQQPEMSAMFITFLLTRNARMQADLVDQLFNSSEKRLARVLLLLAQFGKSRRPETVIPKISQETLAEMIGTTRSRVSFFMNRFRTMGFIDYNGGIQVNNSLLNIFLRE